MAKRKWQVPTKDHPGWIPPEERGKRQPRIDTAEKQDGANNPRRIRSEDAPYHPGYPG